MPAPLWTKGQSGNPKGRPKGIPTSYSWKDLSQAIAKVEKSKGKLFLEHVVEQAWTDPKIMTALLRKLVPDKVEMSGDVDNPLLTQLRVIFVKGPSGDSRTDS